MIEIKFEDGCIVTVSEHVVTLENGEFFTNSNVDYYYDEGGYNCSTAEQVASQYHRNFCPHGEYAIRPRSIAEMRKEAMAFLFIHPRSSIQQVKRALRCSLYDAAMATEGLGLPDERPGKDGAWLEKAREAIVKFQEEH